MAFCRNCGAQLDQEAKFCTACGQPVETPPSNQTNPQQPQQTIPVGPISFGQRNIALAIILTIVTCGIYGLYWLYKLVDELNEASNNTAGQSGGMVLLLSIVTCGIYELIWLYKAGGLVTTAKGSRNLPVESDSSIIYLLLGLFGFGIVSYALIQNELNKVAEYHGAPKA